VSAKRSEAAWNAFRAAYGTTTKEGEVRSGLLAWSMLGDDYKKAFMAGIEAALEPEPKDDK
jgi:hypothetical protein